VGVQIFCTNVVFVGVPPRICIVDHAVAIGIPAVPIIPFKGSADLVLRIGTGAAHRCHLTLFQFGNALRR
jgi:hypothetical protein